MLPLRNGDDIVAIARAAGVKTGLLMLTARADIDDKITGLRRGADDYVTKPFDIGELSARVEAIVRRSGNSTSEQLRGHGIVLDRAARFVLAGNVEVVLTSTEFDLLELLMRHPGVALSRERILHAVWDNPTAVQLTAVDVYISYLRKKIAPHTHTAIETIRGYGYRWQP
jgi:two-component system OmpR family response regulator